MLILACWILIGWPGFFLTGAAAEANSTVAAGRMESFVLTNSVAFPGTRHECWVYVPAATAAISPAALLVFQDGETYLKPDGKAVPGWLERLFTEGGLEPAVALFVNPGEIAEDGKPAGRVKCDRSREYDSLGKRYALFLLEDLIPQITNRFALNVSEDPRKRVLVGRGSGGTCAFTAAWERPNFFGGVICQDGEFVNIRGGDVYPDWIRRTEPKPIRVYMEARKDDADSASGRRWQANQDLMHALNYMGYDLRWREVRESPGSVEAEQFLREAIRWVLRSDPAGKAEEGRPRHSESSVAALVPNTGLTNEWEQVVERMGRTWAPCSDAEGNLYFNNQNFDTSLIYRLEHDQKFPTVWLARMPKIQDMEFGADGWLYAAVQGASRGSNSANSGRIIAINPTNQVVETIVTNVEPWAITVSPAGWIYFTEYRSNLLGGVPARGRDLARPRMQAAGDSTPLGLALSPDGRQLVVSSQNGFAAQAWTVQDDGSLQGLGKWLNLRSNPDASSAYTYAVNSDVSGRWWLLSEAGVEIFERDGTPIGLISRPWVSGSSLARQQATNGVLRSVTRPTVSSLSMAFTFAGPDHSWLYVCTGDRIHRRRTSSQGFATVAGKR